MPLGHLAFLLNSAMLVVDIVVVIMVSVATTKANSQLLVIVIAGFSLADPQLS